jgi:hypothetical protein
MDFSPWTQLGIMNLAFGRSSSVSVGSISARTVHFTTRARSRRDREHRAGRWVTLVRPLRRTPGTHAAVPATFCRRAWDPGPAAQQVASRTWHQHRLHPCRPGPANVRRANRAINARRTSPGSPPPFWVLAAPSWCISLGSWRLPDGTDNPSHNELKLCGSRRRLWSHTFCFVFYPMIRSPEKNISAGH